MSRAYAHMKIYVIVRYEQKTNLHGTFAYPLLPFYFACSSLPSSSNALL